MPALLLPLVIAVVAHTAADSTVFPILNHGRPAGEMVVVRNGESVEVRFRYIDRNRGQNIHSQYRIAADGALLEGGWSQFTLDGQSGQQVEHFAVSGDSIHWSRGRGGRGGGGGSAGSGDGAARIDGASFYRLASGTPWDLSLLARFLIRQPQHSAKLLPTGNARLEFVGDTTVSTRAGRQHVRLAMIYLFGTTPEGIWLDDRNELFATDIAWFITVRPGGEESLPALRKVELAYRNAQGDAFGRRLTKPTTGTIAIINGDLFDSEQAIMRPKMTVLIRGDRVVAVGPADSVRVPPGATVIDATGKTVMPGMWDMHTHFQLTSQTTGTLSQLATGITTIRDLASDVDVAVSIRDRANAGTIVSPRVILAGFIEGPGAWAGPSDVLVRTEDEARAWVARYDSLGYRQIKLYNMVHPDLVPTIAAEAHKRGMRLSGHIPRGLSVPAAVELGYDEIQHAAFLFSTFFQDSLYVPTMRAYSAVAALVAPNVNVDGPEMTGLIRFLKQHNTVIDGTFNIWQGSSGLIGVAGSDAASAAYGKLCKRLYEAGITLVAGTDNSAGTTYNRELELYEEDGIPAAKVLQIATLVPAQVMKDDKDYGSIAPGKVADVVIINGHPAEHVSELRKIDRVIRAGRVYDPAELRAALGFATRP
jgi:imidazolonepropionase-like amidohydrolase